MASAPTPLAAEPLDGQVIIDASRPQWLMRKGAGHLFVCGPGDPEGFLYLGKRRTDGTREGPQEKLIHKLIENARIGWFWLNRGCWKGKQLLPREFFTKYCRPDVASDLPRSRKSGADYLRIGSIGGGSDQSEVGPGVYGFNWWFNQRAGAKKDRFMPHLPADAFQANGHWGRDCMLVIPSLKIVVAARGNWGGTQLSKAKLLMDAMITD